MSLKNIKTNLQSDRGFTIVELLIVVVVIAILAAITIVSYNGITNRANQSASKSTASTVQKKAELFFSENGRYPISTAELTGATNDKSFAVPVGTFGTSSGSGSAALQSNPDASNGTKQVQLQTCQATGGSGTATTANVTGVKIRYWNYGANNTTPAIAEITLGDTSVCTTPTA